MSFTTERNIIISVFYFFRYIIKQAPTYTNHWTDEMLYSYFGLTEDEVKEIESEIKVEQL